MTEHLCGGGRGDGGFARGLTEDELMMYKARLGDGTFLEAPSSGLQSSTAASREQ